MQNKLFAVILAVFLLGLTLASATPLPGECYLVDDFESNTLDSDTWEVRQDPFNFYSLTNSYGIVNENSNYVFRIEQTFDQDRVTYLYLKKTLYPFESLEYDVNLSGTGKFGHMLVTTQDSLAIAMIGTNVYWGSLAVVEEGLTHVTISMNETDMTMKRELPSGNVFENSIPITNGISEFYIGASSKEGTVKADFDNFKICGTEEPPVVPEFGLIAGLTMIAIAIASFLYIRKN